MSISRDQLLAYGACVAFTLIFCIHYIVAKIVMESVDIFALSGLRGIAGGVIIMACFWSQFNTLRWRFVPGLLLVGFLGFCLNQILFLIGLSQSTPAEAAVLSNLIPLASTGFAIIFRLEAFSERRVFGLVFGFAAVALYLVLQFGGNFWSLGIGNVLITLNVLSLGLGLTIAKIYLKDLPSAVVTALMLLGGGGVLSILGGKHLQPALQYTFSSLTAFGLMAFEIVISTALAYLLNIFALARLPVSNTMVFAYLQPMFTGLLVYAIYGALPSLGLIPVFFCIVFATWLTIGDNTEATKD